MYEQMEVRIKGIAPLIVHNGHLANPLNPIVKKMKEVSKKRNKTDEDLERLAELEHFGGLYLDEKERPIIPGEVIESLLIAGAKKHKMGPKAKSGIICEGLFPILYDGPKTPEGLFRDKNFVDSRLVKVGQARVLRTRPIFKDWACEFIVNFLPSQLNERDIELFIDTAGIEVGLCDYRPRFGRFERV